MGSKNAKGKGRSTETKVKNRGPKIVQIVKFDAKKAQTLYEEYAKNGLKFSFNQVMAEMQYFCKDRFCDSTEKYLPYSLTKFKAAVGRLMESSNK